MKTHLHFMKSSAFVKIVFVAQYLANYLWEHCSLKRMGGGTFWACAVIARYLWRLGILEKMKIKIKHVVYSIGLRFMLHTLYTHTHTHTHPIHTHMHTTKDIQVSCKRLPFPIMSVRSARFRGLSWTNFLFYKRLEIYWVAKLLLASQGLFSVETVQ